MIFTRCHGQNEPSLHDRVKMYVLLNFEHWILLVTLNVSFSLSTFCFIFEFNVPQNLFRLNMFRVFNGSYLFVTPLKNPTRRVGGTKPEALVPPALRVGFLRGV